MIPVGRFHPGNAYIKLELLLFQCYQNNEETQRDPLFLSLKTAGGQWGHSIAFAPISRGGWKLNLLQHFMWALPGSSRHQGKK